MRNKILLSCTAGLFAVLVSTTPGFGQDSGSPVNPTPTPQASPAPMENQSPSTGTDKADGPVKDEDVFGFDISMGTAQLTETQRLAAVNTCNQRVTPEPQRFSSAVKTFCDQLR